MKKLIIVLLVCGVACGPRGEDETPTFADHCNEYRYVQHCKELGLPHDVGVEWGCVPTHTFWEKYHELVMCVDSGLGFKCCEAD
jgi:hypothetical protein